jgi:hypothetical protein
MLVAVFELSLYASETAITSRMRFNFEASDRYSHDGEWEGADQPSDKLAINYFGFADGVWEYKKLVLPEGKGTSVGIWMKNSADPTIVNFWWKDNPKTAAQLDYDSRPPFATGEHGEGMTFGWPFHFVEWKVVAT